MMLATIRLRRFLGAGLLFLAVSFGLSCRQAERAQPARQLDGVAQIGGETISREQFRNALQRRYPQSTEELSLAQKIAVLEDLLRQEAIYAKAKAARFDQSAELQEKWKRLVVAEYKEKQYKTPEVTTGQQEIAQYYEANRQRYQRPEEVRGAIIFLQSPVHATAEKKEEFRRHADAILTEAQRGEIDFAQLVQRHSEDQATRYRGGDIGWMTRQGPREPELRKALFSLDQAGQVAPLVPTAKGFYIAKLLEKRSASAVPLAEMKEAIRYQLERQKALAAETAFFESMKAGLEIRIDQKQIEALSTGVVRPEPPRLPGAQTAKITANR